jgi:primosomal protein N' (replication factor Y)
MQRIAIIDIGSNSARLVISHIYKNGAYNMVYNQKEALRLSQKVDGSNMLTEAAFASTIETMKSFAYMCKTYRVDKTIAVATAAIRNAYNGADLVSRVMEETGIQLHIISGNTEAYISYLGVINTLDVKNGIIFDLGGGSTELILFQNRRGFSSFIECQQCGWIPRCPHCDVTLTLHKKSSTLTCHYCGFSTPVPGQCPACEEKRFTDIGVGTEKVEEQIAQLFEGATTLRMDLDTAKTRQQYEHIINDFSNHKADILIGTQMVTKGLDFDNVSVVGILDADTMLNLPDFRSYERTFQTLSQVAGRAGRNLHPGRVILQTRSANSDIIRHITVNDYWQMFYDQMTERQLFRYPPFRRLINVYLRHRDDQLLEHLATETGERLRSIFGDRVLGPERPPVSRIQSLYIRKIMLKIEHQAPITQVREALLSIQNQILMLPIAKNLNIYYDVDPL